MSRQDPGAATGGIPTEPGYCRCTHLVTFHKPGTSGRGACSASTCHCKTYSPPPACCRCDPKLCATDDTGEHCNEQACGVCLHGCPAAEGTPCCREES